MKTSTQSSSSRLKPQQGYSINWILVGVVVLIENLFAERKEQASGLILIGCLQRMHETQVTKSVDLSQLPEDGFTGQGLRPLLDQRRGRRRGSSSRGHYQHRVRRRVGGCWLVLGGA